METCLSLEKQYTVLVSGDVIIKDYRCRVNLNQDLSSHVSVAQLCFCGSALCC